MWQESWTGLHLTQVSTNKVIIALNGQGTQPQRPESPTVTTPGIRVSTGYITFTKGTSSKKDPCQSHKTFCTWSLFNVANLQCLNYTGLDRQMLLTHTGLWVVNMVYDVWCAWANKSTKWLENHINLEITKNKKSSLTSWANVRLQNKILFVCIGIGLFRSLFHSFVPFFFSLLLMMILFSSSSFSSLSSSTFVFVSWSHFQNLFSR